MTKLEIIKALRQLSVDMQEVGTAIDIVLRAAKEHQTLSMVMNQIAEKPRKTKEQRLAKSCLFFLECMG